MPDAGFLELEEGTEPPSPPAGYARAYVDSVDGHLKKKDDTGAVVDLESGGGGGGVTSFNARTGAVVPANGDYTATQITNTPSGGISATNVQVAINELDSEKLNTSHAGSGGSAHSLVDGVAAGFMSISDKTKLDTVSSGATANSSDAFLLARANHTGTQLVATISDFVSSVTALIASLAAPLSHVGAGGTAHALVTTLVSGFMSFTDKLKLDAIFEDRQAYHSHVISTNQTVAAGFTWLRGETIINSGVEVTVEAGGTLHIL